jgi:transposase
MTRTIGLDVHKRQVTFCILDSQGQVAQRGKVVCSRDSLERFASSALQSTDQVVLEATTNTWAVVEILEPHVERVVVSNPLRTRAIASAKIKTDKIDARVLAELLASGFLPEVWQPDAETRRYRALSSRRASLVADRTAIKNRLHSILAMRLIEIPAARLWSPGGRKWLDQLELDPEGRQMLDSDLRLLDAVESEIAELELVMAKSAYPNETVQLLMTLPGIGLTVAQGLLAAWGDMARFPSADKAASYLGLVPSTRQSDRCCYHGSITKQGNSHARWLLVQAAQHLDRHPGPLGVFFRRLAKKKNRNVAVVAGARKLATIAWHMLKNREPIATPYPGPPSANSQSCA